MAQKVSIIIPMYNVGTFLSETLESIKRQTYQQFEVICVDDGSTDNTKEICLGFGDERIRYFEQVNQGSGMARNLGFYHAQGDYIWFFDADDVMYPDALENLLRMSENGKHDLVIGPYNLMDKEGRVQEGETDVELSQIISGAATQENAVFVHPFPGNKLFKKSFLIQHQLSFEKMKIAQDLNLFIKVIANRPSIAFTSSPVLKYRVYEGSSSKSYDERLTAITDVFSDIEKNDYSYFKQYPLILPTLKYNHLTYQLMKCMKIRNKSIRNQVFDVLLSFVKEINIHSLAEEHLISEVKQYVPIALKSKKEFLSQRLRWQYHGFSKRRVFSNFY